MEFMSCFAFASVFFAVVFLCVFLAFRAERKFLDKWPAIDDDEFLRRCSPGTSRETAIKVRRIVSEQLGIPYAHVYPEQHFVNDLGCD